MGMWEDRHAGFMLNCLYLASPAAGLTEASAEVPNSVHSTTRHDTAASPN